MSETTTEYRVNGRISMSHFFTYLLVLSFVIGCSTENPLCTDNYCVTGEIFSKDELEGGQTFEVLPIDESALIVAIDAATVQEGDVVRRPIVEKTTPEEWKTLIESQGNIPVLELITVSETFRIQVGDKTPAFCVSLTDETIDGVNYTAHRSTWVRITGETSGFPPERTTVRIVSVIESSIAEGEICGVKDTEIRADSSPPWHDPFGTVRIHEHRLIIDMTVDGVRQLYISPTTFSKRR